MKLILTLLITCALINGCITSNSKIRLTDSRTGNSVTISDQGLALDLEVLEKDGYIVEVIEEDK